MNADLSNIAPEDISARRIVEMLGMSPHPEGGHFVETWRDTPADGGRGAGTAIYYLLAAGESSHWHRVTDAVEIWHWYAGAPLALGISEDGRDSRTIPLGPNLGAGQRPQFIVQPNWWQAAKSLGDWTLCGCTVSPAFNFDGFEMAPPNWRPGTDKG
jgi:uncharacterized protein